MTTFKEMGLDKRLLETMDKLGFHTPTPIQAASIPLGIEQKDVLGSAQTGTGKTLAFSIPLITNLLKDKQAMALVLTPTRELAQQVEKALFQLTKGLNLRTALLIGGESFGKQLQALKFSPRILVGTPGRLIDHMERGSIKLNTVNFLVLDETDRMFDMGFEKPLKQILNALPAQRQTLMFSATFPKGVETIAAQHMVTPTRISMDPVAVPSGKITQESIEVPAKEKYSHLLQQLETRDGSVIVFVKMKSTAESLMKKLLQDNHEATAMHGNLKQNKRELALKRFKQGKTRIMVATDIAARGIDVPHIKHVINYDLPQTPEDYIHRIGRTARAGADGFSLAMVTAGDTKVWRAIQKYINTNGESGFVAERPQRRNKPNARPFREKRQGSAPSKPHRKGSSNNSSHFGKRSGSAKPKRAFKVYA